MAIVFLQTNLFLFPWAFPYHNFSKVIHFPKVKFGNFIFLPDQRFFILELVLELRGFDIDKMNEEGNKIYNSYSSGNVLLVICGSHLWSFGPHHKLKLIKIHSTKNYFLVRAGIYRQTFVHLYARSSPSTFAYFLLSVVRIGP